MFNGDTDACQGALHHAIADASGPQVIIVSRCNVEQSQYKSYLQLAHKLPTKVIFIGPKTVDPLYLMLSLSGIIKRSEGESGFLFGQERLPLEQVVEYTVKNFNSFQVHPQAYRLQTYNSTPNFETESIMSLSSNRVKEFINENCEQLNSLRLPLDVIVDETVKIIMNIDFDKIVVPEKPVYIGMAVNECDKNILTAYVDTTVPEANDFTLYNHHITQLFLGGKPPPKDANLIKPGQEVIATIESLVVRKRDKASAFKVTSVVSNGVLIEFKNTPHITAKIPLTAKPAESNEFVGKTDDSVEIYECDFVLTLTGFWV